MGRSMSVAGSSFIVVTVTSSPPAAIPGQAWRPVTENQVPSAERPRVRETSSTDVGTRSTAARVAPIALGRNRTA